MAFASPAEPQANGMTRCPLGDPMFWERFQYVLGNMEKEFEILFGFDIYMYIYIVFNVFFGVVAIRLWIYHGYQPDLLG